VTREAASRVLGGLALAGGLATAATETAAKDIGAGALFSICSATPATDRVMDGLCDAYLEGFVTGMRRSGAACPPEEAHKDVRRVYTGLPKAALSDQLAGDLLASIILARYRCGDARPIRS
jgi:hypothetical protein